jgi:hypothetical protein
MTAGAPPASRSVATVTAALARRAAKKARRAYGHLTGWARVLPDFVIIGAVRGGTTSLFRYLGQHPDVMESERKEVHFFDLNYDRGVEWYRAHFPMAGRLRQAARFRRRPITGEATPDYLFHVRAPVRMARLLPSARLIVMLRNPVDRAYSHHRLETHIGFEELPFEDAIEAEERRLSAEVDRMAADPHYRSDAYQHHTYLARGRYAEQLECWLDVFPREQFLIMQSERFFEDPEPEYARVLDFLGLPPHRPARFHRYHWSEPAALDPDLRRRLVGYFRPHNRRLEELLGTTFDWDR